MPYSPIRIQQLDLPNLSGYIGSVLAGSQAVLIYGDQTGISGRKVFLGTIDFSGNTSISGGINFSRTNYNLNPFGQFEVGALSNISADPYLAQLYDLTNGAYIALDWNSRSLSGQWASNVAPSWTGHLVNLGFLQTGNFGANPYVVNTVSGQTISGVKLFLAPASFQSGLNSDNLSIFSPIYQDGDTIFEINSGNNISWSKGQLQNNASVYLNWTGQQLSGQDWKSDNSNPTIPFHIINYDYLTGGAIIPILGLPTLSANQTFLGQNTFRNIQLIGGTGIDFSGNLYLTQSGSFSSGFNGPNVFDPNTATFKDFSNVSSLNYSARTLSGQWKTNNSPSQSGDLINYSYLTSNYANLTGNQNFYGSNNFSGLTTFSGINISGGSGIQLSGNLNISQSGTINSGASTIYDPNSAQFNDFSGNNSLNYDTRTLSGNWNTSGNLYFPIGSGVGYPTGNNSLIGTGRLITGGATITTSAINANGFIFLQRSLIVNSTGVGQLAPSGIVANSYFSVRSLTTSGTINVNDSGSFYWEISNPSN